MRGFRLTAFLSPQPTISIDYSTCESPFGCSSHVKPLDDFTPRRLPVVQNCGNLRDKKTVIVVLSH